MRLKSSSGSLPSYRPVGMEICTLRRATGLSEVLFRDWIAMVAAARYVCMVHSILGFPPKVEFLILT